MTQTFTGKYKIGTDVKFSMSNKEILIGTIWGITFTSDMPPKYLIEIKEGDNWTEKYWEIHENELEAVQ